MCNSCCAIEICIDILQLLRIAPNKELSTQKMPEISRFLGIVIKMFFDDHSPPHFHAIYGDYEAAFSIESLKILRGNLPPRVKGLVIEWASLNQKFKKIKPLV